jgi:Na+/melibiose symporter-like transporter
MTELILTLATLSLAALFGGITAFSAMFAPLIFSKLPTDIAAKFIRAVFPWYYLYIIACAGLGCLFLFSAGSLWLGFVSLIIIGIGVYSRTVLMPLINELRDAELAGDMDAAQQFNVQHRFSVVVNVLQWVLSAYILVAWASPVIEVIPVS